jgi:UDP-N-acetylmuramyl pentapeptide phosphotransferase/UDP-N-acetylglucosamine-1-phosphate transferase
MVLDKFILISIPLIILINFFFIKNYNFLFLKKTKDNKFSKPQAYHIISIPRIGGLLIFFFSTIFLIIFFQKNNFFYNILFLGSFFFLLGFLEDFNIEIRSTDGKILIKETLNNKIELKSLKTGIYFISIIRNDGEILNSTKIIKL